MKKLFTAIVIIGVLALFAGSVFAGSRTMVVRANVKGVWDLQWKNTTSDFGDLPTNDLSNDKYTNTPWRGGEALKFYIRTNYDYQIQFGNDIDHLMAVNGFDNLGGGANTEVVDGRYTPSHTGQTRYNDWGSKQTSGHTNAVIQTQYKVHVNMTWYDNGIKDGPYDYPTAMDYTDAHLLKNAYLDDMGSGPNLWKPSKDYTSPGTLYNHHWTGGAKGTFWITPRIRPLGIGQQPGYYKGDFTLTVSPSQWNGWT